MTKYVVKHSNGKYVDCTESNYTSNILEARLYSDYQTADNVRSNGDSSEETVIEVEITITEKASKNETT